MVFKIKILYFVSIILILIASIDQTVYSQHKLSKRKNVLILHSMKEKRPWNLYYNSSIRESIKENDKLNLELFVENLDLLQYNTDEYKDIVEKAIMYKYKNNAPDVIIITQPNAVRFVYERNMFPQIPKILVVPSQEEVENLPNSAIVTYTVDFKAMLSHALSIFPNTKKIYVVAGNSEIDQSTLEKFKKITKIFTEQVSFKYLTNLGRTAILDTVKNLNKNSFVYYLSYTRDPNGDAYMAKDFSYDLAKSCNRPVFCYLSILTEETGILGGMVVSLKSTAEKTVNILEQLLSGINIENITPVSSSYSYTYDWNEIVKWKINIDHLPEESIFYHRKYSFFELYKQKVILGIILITIYTVLLLMLLYSNRNRKKSESMMNTLINTIPDLVWLKDTKGVYLSCNKRFEDFFGNKKEQIIGKTDYHFVDKELADFFRFHDNTAMNAGKPTTNEEEITFASDGHKEFLETVKTPLYNNKNEIIGILGIGRDITRRIQVEKELILAKEKAEESDQLKSAFLANMSHEIRTPMNGILGFARLLRKPNLDNEKQDRYIEIIELAGKRMLNIINDIVSVAKIESGQMEVIFEETNINDLIEYHYNFFKPEVEAKGMQFKYKNSLPDTKATINTDREKVYAILTNIIKNAIKYTEKGFIEFGYTVKEPNIEFYVKDTGEGIPHEKQEAIFERFIQANIVDDMARQGAGLGLSISKAYVELLGGKIWVVSEMGVGSTFYFTLPK